MSAYFSDSASVAPGCHFGENAVIEDDVVMGMGCELGHNVVVHRGTRLGEGVKVASNAVLGKPPSASATSRRGVDEVGVLVVGAGTIIGASVVINSGAEFAKNCYIGDLAAVREKCVVAEGVIIGRMVVLESNIKIGARARIQTGAYITGETVIEEDVFVGPYVVTTNDRYMSMWTSKTYAGPIIKRRAAVGAGANLLSGITIGEAAVVGMGAVVVTDVPPKRVFLGVPARDAGEARIG
ncbi:MAG: UDP-3-O-(3-hydroxymyristoyl)glucosamine N-acyltransferase [Candidatus Anoxymicrobium japonicum]|uniref:UDP-3-O-(3-hydroxymyristoyl)glucosamine N-acyltransferase n=1 Tax=Candidatus Anoxymicrobium japonicum TaxID=2013648 RepID=A0A2N3G6Z7_9ACTN|nr:MAG: UDP-3-O-(3-hydroxymyristoyl)glucosamine N-acyltransferase [Candidatus Anoxymicrobium japonicum]